MTGPFCDLSRPCVINDDTHDIFVIIFVGRHNSKIINHDSRDFIMPGRTSPKMMSTGMQLQGGDASVP